MVGTRDRNRPRTADRTSRDTGTLPRYPGRQPAPSPQARRVIQQRQEIILGAQDEAERVVATARARAEDLPRERGLTAEARYVGENVLRHAHDNADSAMIEMKRFAQQMLDDVEAAMNRNLSEIADARSRLSD